MVNAIKHKHNTFQNDYFWQATQKPIYKLKTHWKECSRKLDYIDLGLFLFFLIKSESLGMILRYHLKKKRTP